MDCINFGGDRQDGSVCGEICHVARKHIVPGGLVKANKRQVPPVPLPLKRRGSDVGGTEVSVVA